MRLCREARDIFANAPIYTQNRYLAPQLVHLNWGKGARGVKITASHHFSPFRHWRLLFPWIDRVFLLLNCLHTKNVVIYCLQRPICILFKLVHPSHSRSNNLPSQFHWHSLFGKYLRYAQQPPVKLHHEGLLRSMCQFCKQQGAGTRTLNLTNCEPRELIWENSCCANLRCERSGDYRHFSLALRNWSCHCSASSLSLSHTHAHMRGEKRPVGTTWRVQK
jgi:hypothetical protein